MPAVNITIPQWAGWENWQQRAEDRINDAISSANPVLNFVLSPVRGFVDRVLHPLFGFGDFLWRWGIDVSHWVMDRISDAAWSTYFAIQGAISDVTDLAKFLTGLARGYAEQLFNDARNLATGLANDVRAFAAAGIRDVSDFANKVYWDSIAFADKLVRDAQSFTASVITTVRDSLARSITNLEGWARTALDDVTGLAWKLGAAALEFAKGVESRVTDLADALYHKALDAAESGLDLLRRDVLDPLVGAFESFIDHEWKWAFDLLQLLESAAEWIAWVGSRLVPEVVDTYQTMKAMADTDIETLARWGVAIGGA